jgi:heme O synthase-like polyprenyltransferase
MMPVVRGEEGTKFEMLLYTLMLLPLTLVPVLFGAFGRFYGVRLLRTPGVTPTALKLYRYSLLYVALLFLAMAVDRNVPAAWARHPYGVLILTSAAPTHRKRRRAMGRSRPLSQTQ